MPGYTGHPPEIDESRRVLDVVKSALVVGGTGPTGPHILSGLLERGFDVSIFHRGTHEPAGLPDVRHIHGDPHFAETIADAVGDSEYDVVVAAYGRTALLAEAFRGRTGHFLAVGGSPRYAGFNEPGLVSPSGPALPLQEDDSPTALTVESDAPSVRFARSIARTEKAIFAADPLATYLIYPIVYGPRTVWPWELSVIKRVKDGRPRLLIPDEGMAIHSRVFTANAAEFILRAIDRPEASRGQSYNVGDRFQYTVRQWVELFLERMGATAELISVPSALAPWVKAMYVPTSGSLSDHALLDTSKARHQLGVEDVVDVRQAVDELLAWHEEDMTRDRGPAFVDTFDYPLEDELIDAFTGFVSQTRATLDIDVPEAVHPMAHPKNAGALVDQKGR